MDELWADDMIWRGGSLGEHRGTDDYRKFMAAQCRRRLQRHAPGHHPGRRRAFAEDILGMLFQRGITRLPSAA
ncbi:hypothetical protein [Streptomyces melanosporofaciens]|uniref:hypothetical protein n=1 Tax=Streptomyces melanosporofaciens TaxID=67327 RepID=UPI003CC79DF2